MVHDAITSGNSLLIKRNVTDIRATLRNFGVGDTEMIPESVSHVDTKTWSTRYGQLRKQGLLDGVFSFIRCDKPAGTVIIRRQ